MNREALENQKLAVRAEVMGCLDGWFSARLSKYDGGTRSELLDALEKLIEFKINQALDSKSES